MSDVTGVTDELEARLRLLEDERAIQRVLHAYGHAIDYGHEADWLECFTDDGAFDIRMQDPALCSRHDGREQLAAFVAGHTRAPDAYHKHVVVDPQIEIDGDHARVESYFLRVDARDGVAQVFAMGRYRDRLVRGVDGRWRIRERIAEVENR